MENSFKRTSLLKINLKKSNISEAEVFEIEIPRLLYLENLLMLASLCSIFLSITFYNQRCMCVCVYGISIKT